LMIFISFPVEEIIIQIKEVLDSGLEDLG
jgi:hypothetical protein